jgi:histidine ammonia-lyase
MMQLSGRRLPLAEISQVALAHEPVEIAAAAEKEISASRGVVEEIVAQRAIVYGVSTGFGKLADVHIPSDKLEQLQVNLVRSHSCGLGRPLSEPEVRAMMLLRANVLTLGFSGIRLEVIQLLVGMLNKNVCPVIPEKGSVGAIGDLAPLAHLALSLLGEGEAFFNGERMSSASALKKAGLQPTDLRAKEGLALLNGTQAMHAVGGLALFRADGWPGSPMSPVRCLSRLSKAPVAFDERIHNARPHQGSGRSRAISSRFYAKAKSAIRTRRTIRESRMPSLLHAAGSRRVRGALGHCEEILAIESGSATDNPLFTDNATSFRRQLRRSPLRSITRRLRRRT